MTPFAVAVRRPALLGATLAAVLAVPAPASAASVNPVLVLGNPSCADIDPSWSETKREPVNSGTVTQNGLSATLTVNGLSFDWTATGGVDAVIVKGGDNANVYIHPSEPTSDTNLTAPINPNNGAPFGLSHVSFCHDATPPPPPPQPEPPPLPPGLAPPPEPPMLEIAPSPAPVVAPALVQVTAPSLRAPVRTSASMRGPARCVGGRFAATVLGTGIRSVTFFANGRRVRTVVARNGQRRFSVRIPMRAGIVRVRAQVRFVTAAQRASRTLRVTALRCQEGAVAPRFTG